MKKIAILGCENSHADSFLTNIKKKEEISRRRSRRYLQ